MKRLISLAAGSVVAFAAYGATPQAPQSETTQDCANLGEVALLARALAQENIEKPRARAILGRVYDIPDEHARSLAHLVLESAYQDSSPAEEFATKFEVVCMASRGDIESLLRNTSAGRL